MLDDDVIQCDITVKPDCPRQDTPHASQVKTTMDT